jgi:hypothetical protein
MSVGIQPTSTIKKYSSRQVRNNANNNIQNNNNNNESNSERRRIRQSLNKKDIYNNIYRVNMNKIHLLQFDFNRDMIVEVNNEKISKIDNIVNSTKQRLSVEIKNVEDYPKIIFDTFKDDGKKQKSSKNVSYTKKERLADDSSIENKIMEAIDKDEDKDNIMNVFKSSLLAIVTILICLCIYLFFAIRACLDYKTLLGMIKDIISINYSNKIGLYFIREATLLNFPNTGIIGGNYTVIPATNRIVYKNFVRKNIIDLFMERINLSFSNIPSILPSGEYAIPNPNILSSFHSPS